MLPARLQSILLVVVSCCLAFTLYKAAESPITNSDSELAAKHEELRKNHSDHLEHHRQLEMRHRELETNHSKLGSHHNELEYHHQELKRNHSELGSNHRALKSEFTMINEAWENRLKMQKRRLEKKIKLILKNCGETER